jgi:chromosome segregation ATPase
MAHNRGPRWSEEEFDRLGQLVLEYVSSGRTVSEACEAFEKETNGLRTFSANRYKFQTVVLPRIREAYEEARRMGAQVIAEQRRQQQEQEQQQDEDDEERITQRELLRYLRRVRIVDEEAESLRRQVELLQEQLDEANKERENLRSENVLLKTKLKETESERDQLLGSFILARKYATGAPDPDKVKIVQNKDGTIETVKVD